MKKIRYLQNFIFNMDVALVNIFIRRDSKIVLVGAWMGDKFADNSRFLYQYLHLNRDKLGLKRVIWYTRNQKVYDDLKQLGYDVIKGGTGKAVYWHLKSGIHIICNDSLDFMPIKPDIETRFSWGAKKIQLWHGVGMKSVGEGSNKEKKKKNSKGRISNFVSELVKHSSVFSSGGWQNCYFLSSSRFNGEVNIRIAGCRKENLIFSCYPRNCQCLKYMKTEGNVINCIKKYRRSILFLPTFRDANVEYDNPINNVKIRKFLDENNILWIEKSHPADKNNWNTELQSNNILKLDSDFDINVLYPFVDIILTDYSSVSFDAIYHNIPLIMYTPDYVRFKNGNVGFLFDVSDWCGAFMVYTIDDLILTLMNCILAPDIYIKERIESYRRLNEIFWDCEDSSYEKFIKDCKLIKYKGDK